MNMSLAPLRHANVTGEVINLSDDFSSKRGYTALLIWSTPL